MAMGDNARLGSLRLRATHAQAICKMRRYCGSCILVWTDPFAIWDFPIDSRVNETSFSSMLAEHLQDKATIACLVMRQTPEVELDSIFIHHKPEAQQTQTPLLYALRVAGSIRATIEYVKMPRVNSEAPYLVY